ncbi:MAG TPA: dihydropteroate synthase [Thermodesulfobacteriota bacterium]|nr:dihydropteroate synthase [Thermodesulfobacteriota bacterium]
MKQRTTFSLKWRSFDLTMGKKTLVMGVINVTPDSFSDGGLFFDRDKAIAQGEDLAAQGADVLDIGGESTRPFSDPIPDEEEIRRIVPVISALAKKTSLPISVDTYKAVVAKAALDAGASIVNDISSLGFDADLGKLVAEYQVPLVLMHIKGRPRDMQVQPHYDHLLEELRTFFEERIQAAVNQGIDREMILIDPGVGFGKTFHHNLTLIKGLDYFQDLGRPLVLGTSRKSFIGKLTGQQDPLNRDWGTAATLAIGAWQGAHMVRVHNVSAARQVLNVTDALIEAAEE